MSTGGTYASPPCMAAEVDPDQRLFLSELHRSDVTLAPCHGWDGGCYRLGWGGGYFDRTLAALAPRPLAIGIALAAARLPTIYPQPHDIPLDLIVTEDGISCERTALP